MEKTVESNSQQTMSVAWQQHEDLGACMGELYEKSMWTDVKFHCKDHTENERIHAHKIVLAARSPVFQAMFFGPCADGTDDIELDHAEAKVLDLFLRYMYTDSADLDEDTAPSVLKVAHYYQVTKLVQFCANYLATIVTTENACTIFSLSMLYQVTSLRDSCCSFIDKNAEAILDSEAFLELPEELLQYIVKGDTFFTEENHIFTMAEEWAARNLRQENLEKNGPNIRKALGEAFFYLRLPTMKYKTLIDCIRRKGYFSVDEYEDITEFVNEVPFSSIRSNSCVPRIPTEETLILNEEEGITVTTDQISSSFQITVTRDLKLSYFTLAEVQTFLQYNETHFKNRYQKNYINDNKVSNFLALYTGKAIKVQSSCYVSDLEKVNGETLSNKFDVAIYGHFKITCQDEKIQNLDYKKYDEDDDYGLGLRLDDEDDDQAFGDNNLVLEQDFVVLSSKISERIIDLKEHVVLTAAASPYTFNLTLRYSCDSNIEMKTNCSSAIGTKTSVHGQLQVKNIKGVFAGIKSLSFENISRRETV